MTIDIPGFRFPADTPLVSVSEMLMPTQVVLIEGGQFEDGRRRAVIGPAVSADTAAAIEETLIEHERLDGMRRWILDMLAHRPTEGQENR